MSNLYGKKAELARLLFELEAIKFGDFKLKMHSLPGNEHLPLSPIYVMLRTKDHPTNPGPVTQEAMDLIGDLFAEMPVWEFECFTDIPEAGKPFGDQVGRHLREYGCLWATRLTLRKERLEGDARRITRDIDGDFTEGDVCLLVDDLITQADTKLEAIEALESNGLIVRDLLVVVDRMQGGRHQLEKAGYGVHAIFMLDELLDFYVAESLLTQAKADEVTEYIAANQV